MHYTIEEAMLYGCGVERQFVCPVHADTNPSASVNAATGWWVCYGCGAKGRFNSDTLDTDAVVANIERFLQESDEARERSEAFLDQFDTLGPGEYWLSRFSREIAVQHRLGQCYDGTYATIPMRDEVGRLLGIIKRDLTGKLPKYLYPAKVKVSRQLYNYHRCSGDRLILTEGATDAIAAEEVGWPDAMATYRNGLSKYQVEMLIRYAPKEVYVAYDQDDAGNRGYEQIVRVLGRHTDVYRLSWAGYKDLTAIPTHERKNLVKALDKVEHV